MDDAPGGPSMEPHTPGPWREGIEGNPHVYGPDGSGADAGLIANVFKGRGNVRLVAAAPDLLAALKGVLRVADRQTAEFDAARAAIAKAEPEKKGGPTRSIAVILAEMRETAKGWRDRQYRNGHYDEFGGGQQERAEVISLCIEDWCDELDLTLGRTSNG